MRFLSVADRELRSAARQKSTYRARWVTAAIFFLLLVWLLWVMVEGLSNTGRARDLFSVFSAMTFVYCLALSAGRTADSISSERREGTLGLLFLTNLNSAEIIAGKFCSTALSSVYGLVAIFPMLALPMMMGGITFSHFARTVLGLLLGILSALAWGFLASVMCKRHFTAIGAALGLTILGSGGLMLAAAAANAYAPTRSLAPWLAAFSPIYTLIAADGTRGMGTNHFWLSALAVTSASLASLGLTVLLLSRTWRDRPQSVRLWQSFRSRTRSERPPSPQRAALRRRLLGINPLFWLAGRQRVSAPVIMVLAVIITMLTVYLAAPYFGRVMTGAWYAPVLGHLFSWLWAGLAIHALVLYYAASTASQRLAEDKQTGALELLLSTPTTERTILRGLWLAFARKMVFPALLAILVHCFFIYLVLVMMTFDPPQQLPSGVTPGEVLWSSLLDQPLRGRMLDWEFGFILRLPVLALPLLMLAWPTLGFVGRWLGLRMKHPGFAPMGSLALLSAPPILLFTLFCYIMEKLHYTQGSGREFLVTAQWVAFTIGCGHCVLLSAWAATSLRRNLRAVAMSRYQPLPAWRWRLPHWRVVWRFGLGTAAFATAVVVLVASYYGFRNWRSKRVWQNYQTALLQSGESLSLAPLLPAAVPADSNFARSPAFLELVSPTNRAAKSLLDKLAAFDLPANGTASGGVLENWAQQTRAPLQRFISGARTQTPAGSGNRRNADATALLQDLAAPSLRLPELAAAAAHCTAFQTVTNRDPQAVLRPARNQIVPLERLHLLFEVQACAALAVGQNTNAANDVLAGLRVARLAGQWPDTRASARLQILLSRSLQPVWEGLSQHAWSEPQLASLQQELASFNLLADYTNTVRRAVLAHIEVWRAIPTQPDRTAPLPAGNGGYRRGFPPHLRHAAGWYNCCIQLYEAGRWAVEQVDPATGRVQPDARWVDLSDLPVDASTQELLQQSLSWGASPSSLAFVQTSVNQAAIACALERFRLVNSTYPESLASLQPTLLPCVPHDAISGRPMIYQYVGTNSFILRGVGPNGADDRTNSTSDDWLWTYTAKKPSGKKK